MIAVLSAGCPELTESQDIPDELNPPDYADLGAVREMVSLNGGTVTGSGADGVFINGRIVKISPFMIAKYETAWDLWNKVRSRSEKYSYVYTSGSGYQGHQASSLSGTGSGTSGASWPVQERNARSVTQISWRDAVVWCNAYSEMCGLEPVYLSAAGGTVLRDAASDAVDSAFWDRTKNGWRLPTEAEWEYAARGGDPAKASEWDKIHAGSNTIGDVAWYGINSEQLTVTHKNYGVHPVGSLAPNAAGFCDMSGNVFEWCWDLYALNAASNDSAWTTGGIVTNPAGAAGGAERIARGGAWRNAESNCTVTYRGHQTTSVRYNHIGSRLARNTGGPDAGFVNPVNTAALPDPFLFYHDGWYYLAWTTGGGVRLARSKTIAGFWGSAVGDLDSKVLWTPGADNPYRYDVWAPEIHNLDGKWYCYYTATNNSVEPARDASRRSLVLECSAANPWDGTWTEKARVFDSANDFYSIDATVMKFSDKRYFVWSGKPNSSLGQCIYITEMENPWTLRNGTSVQISVPAESWEKVGWSVNEGPAILYTDNYTAIVYSASGYSSGGGSSAVTGYCLGMLRIANNKNPLNKADWTKETSPLFTTDPARGLYNPGHNSFFKSPDGTELWMAYHAYTDIARTGPRMLFLQPFTLNAADEKPVFGSPMFPNIRIKLPSGE